MRDMRFVIQLTQLRLSIKVAAMTTIMFYTLDDAVFNQLRMPNFHGVVFKHLSLHRVSCCFALDCSCYLGKPVNEHAHKDNDVLHSCRESAQCISQVQKKRPKN